MAGIDFETLTEKVLSRLKKLPATLTYHAADHTIDVVKQSGRIAKTEGIAGRELHLLELAALYHDTGFLQSYDGHEKKSCEIFLQDVDEMELSEADITLIIDLIMATKVPQRPKTLLQKVLCDADLDYLGREDFTEIASRLKQEFLNYGIVSNETEWKVLQSKFLKEHHYHTASSQKLREPVKALNYLKLS